ncbi:pyruvate dehydrogenase E2 component (dihydrolipoamide acetyltransferase) [Steroidobacter denitrificans]|uniref:Dihydrolipoamide acetyltransferase component of pyruvate dehydrogenase complex n=1 Tax=Steroidobacter denitrificans TaxID=465721 RepID=A0A127FB52_STEDE|nr:2-oxo acid dehydrogenase subunit E2 [Steroidobacter denitrificans]AMN47654.1 pyruvate dehydrogenase E2 component (dihydrolipoamide acetyltransferase) [Steroidobacter denitrificans]
MAQDITVPDLGDFKDVEVIDVLITPGDVIEVDTPLITIETEKATMDVPSTVAGTITAVALKKGDRVSKGSLIAQFEAGVPAASTERIQEASQTVSQTVSQAASPAAAQPASAESPSALQPPAAVFGDAGAPTATSPAAASRSPVGADVVPDDKDGKGEAPVSLTAASSFVMGEAGFARAYASPSVRRFARELGVDLTQIEGSGLKGRITPDDVKAWVKRTLASGVSSAGGGALPKIPEIDFAKFGPIESQPLGRIQKISGPHLQASWLNIPHVWQMDEADITAMDAARIESRQKALDAGIKLTPLAFILRACVQALQEFPFVNSSLDASGANLVLKKYMHLGFAADTPQGLLVPVIRDADKKDIYELARELGTLSQKAREGKLSAADMQGASFTVSSLGGIGGTSFTPIINAPEVAILGVARASMKPVWQEGQFVPRLILPFTLAYDHRVIDGAAGARFTSFLARKLADVNGLLEAVP